MDNLRSVIDALQEHLSEARVVSGYKHPVGAITCKDGTRFSVQASSYAYCHPRDNTGPWTHVEVMTLTNGAIPRHWTQDSDAIGAYVPIEAVAQEIVDRGSAVLEDKNDR